MKESIEKFSKEGRGVSHSLCWEKSRKPLGGLLVFVCLIFAGPVSSEEVYTAGTRVELVAGLQSAQPGQVLLVAIHFQMDPGWHIYWKNPGDSGIPPQIKWTLPEGFKAGDIEWPFPHNISMPPLLSYGYEGETFLYTDIQVPNSVAAGASVRLSADLTFLASQIQCVPGIAHLDLDIPVDSIAPEKNYLAEEIFQKKDSLVPTKLSSIKAQAWDDGRALILKVKGVGNDFLRGAAYFYPEQSDLIQHAAEQKFRKEGNGFVLVIPRSTLHAQPISRISGVVVGEGEPARAFEIDAPVNVMLSSPPATQGARGLLVAVLSALIGGLILNLMPCVLPVLVLKVLSLIEKSGSSRRESLRHGFYFSAGVIVCFWALAGILLLLQLGGRQVGWGFQFQSPAFVAALSVLFFFLALSMWGIVNIDVPWFVRNWIGGGSGGANPFANGIIATLAATPCTAPFMGSALGYALTQSFPATLLVFTALGLGMALPYLVLCAFPEFLKFVPKPGRWMITFKRFLAVPFFLTVLWLGWVLWTSRGVASVAFLSAGLVIAGAAFVIERGKFAFPIGLAGVLIAVGGANFAPAMSLEQRTSSEQIAWQPYSAQALQDALSQGKSVFIDFTASWCLSCQVNERVALENPQVVEALREHGVVTLKADWTSYDERITQALAGYGKNSIPVYVLYIPGQAQPVFFPELITPAIVLEGLKRIP